MWDLIIIGGGILGAVLAREATSAGANVLLVRRSDRVKPDADTLRNQAWLQSGLLYAIQACAARDRALAAAGKTAPATRTKAEHDAHAEHARGIERARAMRFARTLLARQFREQTRGLLGKMAINDATEQAWFEESYVTLGMPRPRRLALPEARYRCGAFYRATAAYYEIEDRVFDESRVVALSLAAGLATRRLQVVQVDDVKLHRVAPGPVTVQLGNDTQQAKRIVVAAGCGTPLLLRDLEIEHRLKVTCTPLMVLESSFDLETSVLIDRSKRYSVTHPLRAARPRVVFGVGGMTRDLEALYRMPADRDPNRLVEEHEKERLRDVLKAHADRPVGPHRFTAGFEIMPAQAKGTEEVAPIVERWDQPGTHLWWALPGRATQSLATARTVYADLGLSSLGGDHPPPSTLPSCDLDDLCMYFDPSYDHARGD